MASNHPVESGAKYSNAVGVRPIPATQVGHLSAIVRVALCPPSIKKKHSASTSSHTGEFQPRALTGHSDLASAQSATPKLSVIEGDGPVGILNGHPAGTNNLVFKKK